MVGAATAAPTSTHWTVRKMLDDEQDVAALQRRIRDLEDVLSQNDCALLTVLQLPPVMTKILSLLLAVPTVTVDMARKKIGTDCDFKAAIYRLRKYLKKWDVTIHSRRRVGYWIDADDKERIKNLLLAR